MSHIYSVLALFFCCLLNRLAKCLAKKAETKAVKCEGICANKYWLP